MRKPTTHNLNIRLDDNYTEKLNFVCNHLKLTKSDAMREALGEWLNDRMLRIKLKRIFVEEE